MRPLLGEGIARLDGEAKARGDARFTADMTPVGGLLDGALVLSTIAAGRVRAVDSSLAEAVPGFVGLVTHENSIKVSSGDVHWLGHWLQDDLVHYAGQPVALVVAASSPAAQEVASLVSVEYEPAAAAVSFLSCLDRAVPPAHVRGEAPDTQRGDPPSGFTDAAAVVEETYTTPTHVHNPIEPHAVIAHWEGKRVTVETSTSGIFAARDAIAQAFALPVEDVRVLMQFLGGGFGSKGSAWWPSLVLAVAAARLFDRPVRLELRRDEMFTVVGRRAATVQRVRLGATAEGGLTAVEHEATQETSMLAEYSDSTCFPSRIVYACPNVAVRHRVVRLNRPQPNAMRAPGEGPGSFALESALDELAYELSLDPLALRLRNIAARDQHDDREWSSNGLRECLTLGAEAFGWESWSSEIGAKRDGDWRIGYGVASAYYPVFRDRAAARIRIEADGAVVLECGNQEIGNGSMTIMAQAVASELGVPIGGVRVEFGDTVLPEAPMAAGSMSTASVIPAIEQAAGELRATILTAAISDAQSRLCGHSAEDVEWESPWLLRSRTDAAIHESAQALLDRLGLPYWEAEAHTEESAAPDRTGNAFGACFVEVRVDPVLGLVRVARVTAAYAAGRILNARTARSQYVGGIVFGIGMALHERVQTHPGSGLVTNRNLSEYLIPTHADVPDIDVHLVEEEDRHLDTAGVKGIGMISTVGVAAAIANAVYNAAGKRIRELPIVPELVIESNSA